MGTHLIVEDAVAVGVTVSVVHVGKRIRAESQELPVLACQGRRLVDLGSERGYAWIRARAIVGLAWAVFKHPCLLLLHCQIPLVSHWWLVHLAFLHKASCSLRVLSLCIGCEERVSSATYCLLTICSMRTHKAHT